MTTSDPVRPRIICVLAAPRTGSSLLCRVLEGIPGSRRLGELFDPGRIGRRLSEHELAALVACAGGHDALTGWGATHPGRVLDLLLDPRAAGPLVIKMLPGHLDRPTLLSEVLSRTDIGFVTLSRRPIESFISVTKARLLMKYQGVDTTSLRPRIDSGIFNQWAREWRSWFQWLDLCLESRSISPPRISYERDLSPDPFAAGAAVAARFGYPFATSAFPIQMQRQDLETDFRRRVANWKEFSADADPELLAWATGVVPPSDSGPTDEGGPVTSA